MADVLGHVAVEWHRYPRQKRDQFALADLEIDAAQYGHDVLALAVGFFQAGGAEEGLGRRFCGVRGVNADTGCRVRNATEGVPYSATPAARRNATEGVPYSAGPWPLAPGYWLLNPEPRTLNPLFHCPCPNGPLVIAGPPMPYRLRSRGQTVLR